MRFHIVEHGTDALDLNRDPGVHLLNKVHPVRSCALRLVARESFTCGRPKSAEDVALTPASVINLTLAPDAQADEALPPVVL